MKQKPIQSTNTNPTNYIYILEAEGDYKEVEWIQKEIKKMLDKKNDI